MNGAAPLVVLVPVADRARFWNVHQKYLYEMTRFYPEDMDDAGNLHYGHFESYFAGDPDRHAFYLRADGREVGFALINRYSHLGREIDHALAEFTVYPSYRGRGYAREAVGLLFARWPGRWELKYNTANASAARLWTSVTLPYAPERTAVGDREAVLSFRVGADGGHRPAPAGIGGLLP